MSQSLQKCRLLDKIMAEWKCKIRAKRLLLGLTYAIMVFGHPPCDRLSDIAILDLGFSLLFFYSCWWFCPHIHEVHDIKAKFPCVRSLIELTWLAALRHFYEK